MTAYTITGAAIKYYPDALAQFEHLLGRLTHEEFQGMTLGVLMPAFMVSSTAPVFGSSR